MSLVIIGGNVVNLLPEIDIFVAWKFIPGRGPVPIAGRGERAAIRKSGKSFKAVVGDIDKKKKEPVKKKTVKHSPKFDPPSKKVSGMKEEEAKKWAEETGMDQEHKNLTPRQQKAIKLYTSESGNYIGINDSLRGKKDPSDNQRAIIEEMTTSINKTELPTDLLLQRALKVDNDAMVDFAESLTVGKVFTDKAFTSTTLGNSKGTAVQFIIRAPKGTKGIEVFSNNNPSRNSKNGSNELEILLQRGTKFKVTKTIDIDNAQGLFMKKINLDIVGQEVIKFQDKKVIERKKVKIAKKKDLPKPDLIRLERFSWTSSDIDVE